MYLYVGIITLITLHVLNNSLAQKWVLMWCCIYRTRVVLKTKRNYFWRMWYRISYSQNYYSIPNLFPHHPFNDFIFNPKSNGIVSSTQTQNNLVWILFWRNRLPPFSECLLNVQTVNSSETLLSRSCYPNLDHIMFLHHCEILKQKT
jgi:hypothetical protein